MSSVDTTKGTRTVSAIAGKQQVKLEVVRELDLAPGTKPPFIAAASGLVRAGNTYWVVADDELVLGAFPVRGGPGKALVVFPGTLPEGTKERKAVKPDLEALFLLPRSVGGAAGDVLVGVPSGSKPNRYRGIAVPLSGDGDAQGPVQQVDWTPLFAALAPQFPKLNIEGAAIVGDRLRLAQRGNGKNNVSAIVDLDLNEVARAITAGRPIPPSAQRGILRLDLGTIHHVPWTITDLAPLPDGRLVFTAAAESSNGVVDDGKIAGSALGILDADGTVASFVPTSPTVKLEGIWVSALTAKAIDVVVVSDADDATVKAVMYTARLPLP